jgi:hypothetical protein
MEKNMSKVKADRKVLKIFLVIFFGVVLRYAVSLIGHNFDFDSYCIVGKLVCAFKNVYASTSRYNYGPIFFIIQGILYQISKGQEQVFRFFIILILTLADLGITFVIANKYSWKKATIFFLNPISIIITGYHNQFDNIAIFLALLSTYFYNEDKEFNKKDIVFVLLVSLSLITKHILFLIPVFILLRKNLPIKKKIVYAIIPPLMFLLSFVPFAIYSKEAFYGILENVFFYKSSNNSPLFSYFYNLINFPENLKIIVFGISMCIIGFIVRKRKFEDTIMLYLISLVTFSSAIANQYLVIPMVALCVFDTGILKYVYMLTVTFFLTIQYDGLNKLYLLQNVSNSLYNFGESYIKNGYIIATYILFYTLIYLLVKKEKQIKNPMN